MAKQKEKNELAKTNGNTALAEPSQYARPFQMEGEDSGDMLVPRIVLHQGDISEKWYGQHPKGTLLDSTTQEPIIARKFVPIGIAWKEWARFEESRPVYRTRDKSAVPPEDLEWHDQEPPAAELTRNFVVLMEGESMPICLSLKDASKHQRNAGKLLNQMEKMRAANRRQPGLYLIEIVDTENAKGKWKEFKLKPLGDAPDDFAALALNMYAIFGGRTVTVQEAGDVHETVDTPEPVAAAPSGKPYDPNDD